MKATNKRKLFLVGVNAGRHLIVPIASVIISVLVFKGGSRALWGEAVHYLISVSLIALAVGFGNKDYLLRLFSQEPQKLAEHWRSIFITRIPALLLGMAGLYFLSASTGIWVLTCFWLLALYLYQSFDAVIQFDQRFSLPLMAEITAMAVACLWLYLAESLTLFIVVQTLTIAAITKAFLVLMTYSRLLKGKGYAFSPGFYLAALPFFLIGLSGLLQSKTDLYLVNLLTTKAETGEYQIIANLFLYTQALAGFILGPFAKNLYRIDDRTAAKLPIKLLLLGLGLLAVALPAIYLLTTWVYEVEYSQSFYIAGALMVAPIFYYLPLIYNLYKQGRERFVMAVNFGGAAVNLIATAWLLSETGILGALIGSAISQWVMLLIYIFGARKSSPTTV